MNLFDENKFAENKNGQINESQQVREFTLLIQKVIGVSEEDLAANRNGEFPFKQRVKILQRNWFWVLALIVIIAYFMWQFFSMWLHPAFIDDAVIFTIINLGLMFFILGVLYFTTFGTRGVITALLGQRVEQVEGIAQLSSQTSGVGKSRRTQYFVEIYQAISLEIPEQVYNALADGLYYRIFYVPLTKYLVSAEALKLKGESEQLIEQVPYKPSAKDLGGNDTTTDNANSVLDQKIDREFPPETREKTRSLLNRLTLINKDIIQKRILELAKGDAAKVESLVKKIEKEDDYREALMFLK